MHLCEVAVLVLLYNGICVLQGLFREEPQRQSTPDLQLLQV